jgi:hypothetical protein
MKKIFIFILVIIFLYFIYNICTPFPLIQNINMSDMLNELDALKQKNKYILDELNALKNKNKIVEGFAATTPLDDLAAINTLAQIAKSMNSNAGYTFPSNAEVTGKLTCNNLTITNDISGNGKLTITNDIIGNGKLTITNDIIGKSKIVINNRDILSELDILNKKCKFISNQDTGNTCFTSSIEIPSDGDYWFGKIGRFNQFVISHDNKMSVPMWSYGKPDSSGNFTKQQLSLKQL